MLSAEHRSTFAHLGLDIAVVEARVTKAAGTPVEVVGATPVFMGTGLVLQVPATGRKFLLDIPEDDMAWPYPPRWFRSSKAVPVTDLGSR